MHDERRNHVVGRHLRLELGNVQHYVPCIPVAVEVRHVLAVLGHDEGNRSVLKLVAHGHVEGKVGAHARGHVEVVEDDVTEIAIAVEIHITLLVLVDTERNEFSIQLERLETTRRIDRKVSENTGRDIEHVQREIIDIAVPVTVATTLIGLRGTKTEEHVPEDSWPRILEAISFDSMKSKAEEYVPAGGSFWKGGAQTFMNKGTNGRWREVLSEEELAQYDALCEQALTPDCRRWLEHGRQG